MRTGILLSVREKAKRFPGKVLKPLGNSKTVTEFLLDRLKNSVSADKVILSTSTDKRDNVLCEIAQQCNVESFRGSEDDKLLRYRDTAKEHNLDFVVIVDGDDPFISVEHIDKIISYAENKSVDYLIYENLPLGATGFGVRVSALDNICNSRPEEDTEVWGHYFTKNKLFHCHYLIEENSSLARPDVRMTLDYPEDYLFFQTVATALLNQHKDCSLQNIIEYLEQNPDVIKINSSVQKLYEENLRQHLPD